MALDFFVDPRNPMLGTLGASLGFAQLCLEAAHLFGCCAHVLIRLSPDLLDLRIGHGGNPIGPLSRHSQLALKPSKGPLDFGPRASEALVRISLRARNALLRLPFGPLNMHSRLDACLLRAFFRLDEFVLPA